MHVAKSKSVRNRYIEDDAEVSDDVAVSGDEEEEEDESNLSGLIDDESQNCSMTPGLMRQVYAKSLHSSQVCVSLSRTRSLSRSLALSPSLPLRRSLARFSLFIKSYSSLLTWQDTHTGTSSGLFECCSSGWLQDEVCQR